VTAAAPPPENSSFSGNNDEHRPVFLNFGKKCERERKGDRRKRESEGEKWEIFRVSRLLYHDRFGLVGPAEPTGPVWFTRDGFWAQEANPALLFFPQDLLLLHPPYCRHPLSFFCETNFFLQVLNLDFFLLCSYFLYCLFRFYFIAFLFLFIHHFLLLSLS
jgi:hypothetical protein